MTLFSPSLQVRRLLVARGGANVFDAEFHSGLNIIRGENSSGKSTILDFLFFGLGGDLTEWREAASTCDSVTVEVLLNGTAATLQRDIAQGSSKPMRIFPGPLAEADKSSTTGWGVYPYRRTGQRESFSQVIFRWLGMPEVVGDGTSNITLHQVLRLLYSDQITPIDRLFRVERFDTPLIRQTVGDLLCGAFDDALYRAQVRRRQVDQEYDAVSSELRSIFTTMGSVPHSLTLEWVSSERREIERKISEVQAEILKLEERIFHGEVSDGLSLVDQEKAYEIVRSLQEKLADKQTELDDLQLEIADSDLFIKSLQAKLAALNDAAVTADALKGISFVYCPACFAPVDEPTSQFHCHLCKAPFDRDRAQSRILLLINDIALQEKQSKELQQYRVDNLRSIERELTRLKSEWEGASRRYKLANKSPTTELRSKAKELHREAGYLERSLEELNSKAGLIDRIDQLSKKKADLERERSMLNDKIDAGDIAQKNRLSKSYTAIADNVRKLLKIDLARQDTFDNAESIEFSFADDRISVNGESFFSASSMVYLRNSFLVSLWKAAIEDKAFRHPRILILDTVEDKGMEPKRSHNFQNILKEISEVAGVENQLIYATSMISPDLENSKYVVGRFYTHDHRTLAL